MLLLRNSSEVSDNHVVDVRVDDAPVSVDADESQIRQIVWNLATNGLRAMPAGGALCVSAVNETAAGVERRVLLVEDQGVGIPPEEVDSIFQPFRGSFGKGTGRLAIVNRIVTETGA